LNKIIKKYSKKQNSALIFLLILVSIFFVFSCTGSKSVTSIKEPNRINDIPLEKSYEKIIIQKFEVDQDLEKNYPGVTVTCESTAMNELLKVSSISKIEKARASSIRQTGAIVVKTRVTSLTLSGSNSGNSSARSEMAVNVRLIDSATGIIIREKDLSTFTSTSASSSDSSQSDQMLPYDLGKIIAQYVAAALGGN
jgi:hypothetical protein